MTALIVSDSNKKKVKRTFELCASEDAIISDHKENIKNALKILSEELDVKPAVVRKGYTIWKAMKLKPKEQEEANVISDSASV